MIGGIAGSWAGAPDDSVFPSTMTEPEPDRSELAPPNAADPSAPLVEDQGIDAGTEDQDGTRAAAEGARQGGDADGAPDPHQLMAGHPAESQDDELVGAPGADPNEPSQQYGTSGQDAGSMD